MAAFADNGNSELVGLSEKYLREAKSTDESNKGKAAIISTLEGAAANLQNSGNPHFESIIRMLLFLSSPTCVQRAKAFEDEYSASGNIGWALKKTAGTVASPITVPVQFVGGLFTGKAPLGIDPSLWVIIRWSIIVVGGAYTLRSLKGLVGLGDD